MSHKFIFFLILGIDALVLLLNTSQLSISYHEASMLYGDFSFLQVIIKSSLYIFGQNDFALRLPMILLHILSFLLLYKISKRYLKHKRDRLWLMLIFVLLPGVTSSAMLIDSAGFVIFGLLLFIYLYENIAQKYIYALLLFFMIADGGFAYLFFALIFFSIHIKDRYFMVFNIVAFAISMTLYGLNTEGLPEGYFLDAIGLYAAIFTPIVFVYIFYTLYRRYLTKERDLLWFISSVTLLLSLLLSFRQRVEIEHFAPYLIIALPLAAQIFSSSYRVRLKVFRGKYRAVFIVSLVFLLLNSLLVLFNKNIYLFLDEPQKHFAYKMHVAKELADELKSRGVSCVSTHHKMQQRLKFYDILKCENYILSQKDISENREEDVTISYKNIPLYSASVTKINTK
ncbi:MAG: glycosyltransferase family 39 protein [Sulfurimonas sp.]|nr:glycosyltransferase family 39 protein [Sulfurimonas sp.]